MFLLIAWPQIAPRRGKPSQEALACVGSFANAMKAAMEPHVRALLDAMFSSGLSPTLVEALEQITVRYFIFFDASFSMIFSFFLTVIDVPEYATSYFLSVFQHYCQMCKSGY